MGKPKHRRCMTCGAVTSRYVRTTRQGPFTFAVWARDARNGEVEDGVSGRFYCAAHAVRSLPALAPTESVTDTLLRRAADDESLDDDTFTVLSRALRGVDPIGGGVPA